MAVTLLLVRHGQSQANLENKCAGHSDFPLTELGLRQAERTARYLENEPIDVLLSSDLQRAYQTAQAIAAVKGMEVQPQTRFREIFCGDWESKPVVEVEQNYPEDRRLWREDFLHASCPHGESVKEKIARAAGVLAELAREFEGKRVCIATHAAFLRAMTCVMYGEGEEKINDIPFASNASVTEGIYENGAWRVVRYSYDDHMGELVTSLAGMERS